MDNYPKITSAKWDSFSEVLLSNKELKKQIIKPNGNIHPGDVL